MKHAPLFFALTLVSAEFFKAAMTLTKMKLKEVAYLMRIDEAQLRRQLEGDGHLSVKRMESLPLLKSPSLVGSLYTESEAASKRLIPERRL